jgi:hypothetical protein
MYFQLISLSHRDDRFTLVMLIGNNRNFSIEKQKVYLIDELNVRFYFVSINQITKIYSLDFFVDLWIAER